jgi:hypothetical protein
VKMEIGRAVWIGYGARIFVFLKNGCESAPIYYLRVYMPRWLHMDWNLEVLALKRVWAWHSRKTSIPDDISRTTYIPNGISRMESRP